MDTLPGNGHSFVSLVVCCSPKLAFLTEHSPHLVFITFNPDVLPFTITVETVIGNKGDSILLAMERVLEADFFLSLNDRLEVGVGRVEMCLVEDDRFAFCCLEANAHLTTHPARYLHVRLLCSEGDFVLLRIYPSIMTLVSWRRERIVLPVSMQLRLPRTRSACESRVALGS